MERFTLEFWNWLFILRLAILAVSHAVPEINHRSLSEQLAGAGNPSPGAINNITAALTAG